VNENVQPVNKTATTSSVSSVGGMISTTTTSAPPCEGSTEHAMNADLQRVLEFFSNEIEQYVIGDLVRLREIRPDKETGLRGCAVPQAMLVFAVLNLFGYLINERETANTLENFKAIFSSKQGLFPAEYEKEACRIVKLFRHGMMHQFFPKASAVAKVGENMPLILSQDTPCLNVDRLTKDVINAIRELRQRVASENYDDLMERINSRLNALARDDFGKAAKLARQDSMQ
jgi:hypothetical protein